MLCAFGYPHISNQQPSVDWADWLVSHSQASTDSTREGLSPNCAFKVQSHAMSMHTLRGMSGIAWSTSLEGHKR